MTSISSVAVYEATVAPVYGPAMSSDIYERILEFIASHIALQHKKDAAEFTHDIASCSDYFRGKQRVHKMKLLLELHVR